jgi:hypothetical protein
MKAGSVSDGVLQTASLRRASLRPGRARFSFGLRLSVTLTLTLATPIGA